jgi:hypothetical protein
MQDQLEQLKQTIRLLSSNKNFIHHKWFIKWHLEILERIALELCNIYTKADKDIVIGLVWMHDYAKIIDFEREHDTAVIRQGVDFLKELGFADGYIQKLINYIEIFESKMEEDLSMAPIEVQIVSSADAASHLIGPFYSLHWYENPDLTVEELLQRNIAKLNKDWERKITIPEVKEKFQARYNFIKEQSGLLPDSFLT